MACEDIKCQYIVHSLSKLYFVDMESGTQRNQKQNRQAWQFQKLSEKKNWAVDSEIKVTILYQTILTLQLPEVINMELLPLI